VGPLGLVLVSALALANPSSAQIVRTDHMVASDPGIRIDVREVRRTAPPSTGAPLLLLHGARVPGVASFDLPVPGGSIAEDFAAAGHPTFVMDARGYGRSTRPPEMSDPPEAHAPLVHSDEVVRDVAAVADWIRKRTGASRIDVLGWATGGHWLGNYAALHPDRVGHLVMHNTLYAGSDVHPLLGHGTDLEDPEHPGRFNARAFGAYRWTTAASTLGAWDRSIPEQDKSLWRDPAVAEAYVEAALASDPAGRTRNPPAFRAPSGAMEDSFALAIGRPLWDASRIRAAVLITVSQRDFWSRPEDRERLAKDLVHAKSVRVVVIPNATHHVHLDRPERGRKMFMEAVLTFLEDR
jgi:pimeloyl-ACP methyl ester carboxylesterase